MFLIEKNKFTKIICKFTTTERKDCALSQQNFGCAKLFACWLGDGIYHNIAKPEEHSLVIPPPRQDKDKVHAGTQLTSIMTRLAHVQRIKDPV